MARYSERQKRDAAKELENARQAVREAARGGVRVTQTMTTRVADAEKKWDAIKRG